MPRIAMSSRSRARLALPIVALGLAACGDGPSAPTPTDLDFLRAAQLAGDSVGATFGFGLPPVRMGGPGVVVFAPMLPPDGASSGSGCAYSASSGWVECAARTFNGMTFESAFAFFDRDGNAQQRPDPATTDRVASRAHMFGTTTFPMRTMDGLEAGSVTLTTDRRDEHTTSGLLDPEGRRRFDGTAEGGETVVITTSRGTGRSDRTFADTTSNLVVRLAPMPMPPAPGTPFMPPVPTSGRVVRVSHAVDTPPGGQPRTMDVRLVTEFLGNGTARTTITVNGETHVCTQDLTRNERPQCS